MKDFERLNELANFFRKKQQEYWRIGDRERPQATISFFYTFLFALAVSVLLFFVFPFLKSYMFCFFLLPLQVLLLAFFGWRFFQFKRSMAKMNQSIIQTKDDIVAINHRHFQKLIHEIQTTLKEETKDFAEFFCYIAAFFGFVTLRSPDRSSPKVILPLMERWNIPEGTELNQLCENILNTNVMQSLPAKQNVGILAAFRENVKTISGIKKETDAKQYDFENSIYLLVYLSKDGKFVERFRELAEYFIF